MLLNSLQIVHDLLPVPINKSKYTENEIKSYKIRQSWYDNSEKASRRSEKLRFEWYYLPETCLIHGYFRPLLLFLSLVFTFSGMTILTFSLTSVIGKWAFFSSIPARVDVNNGIGEL